MADKDNGWIKISRDIRKHWVWDDPVFFRAWIDILLEANHKPKKVVVGKRTIEIGRGQFLTSGQKLARNWKCSRKTVYKILETLEKEQMVTRKGTPTGTTLTVINYDKFQNYGTTEETTVETRRGTATETTRGTTWGTQPRMIKNDNNKNDKERKEKDAPLGYSSTGIPYDHVETVDGEQWFCWKDEQGGWHMENAKKEEYPRW